MKLLLINLPWSGLVSKKTFKIHFALPPLDLILLHNLAVAARHEARIIDGFVEHEPVTRQLLDWADWIVVATTPYSMWQCPNCEWGWIKNSLEKFPRQKVVLIGLHGSIYPKDVLCETGVHAVVRREPEGPFLEFLNKGHWHQCHGVSFLSDGIYHENLPAEPVDLDRLVVQNYSVDISKYSYFLLGNRTGIFEASRGCPWRCTFCCQEMFNWHYRFKSPQIFADEVSHAVQTTGMQTAYFFDLEFTLGRERVMCICEEFQKNGIARKLKWTCQTRADLVDRELLESMRAAGCRLIHYGVETADVEALAATNKKITLEQIEEGILLTKSVGLQTAAFFMFGLPGETPASFQRTLKFARRLNPTYASFHFAVPLPGTELHRLRQGKSVLTKQAWPAAYFQDWSARQRALYLARAYLLFYFCPKRIEWRELKWRLCNGMGKLRYLLSILTPSTATGNLKM